MSEEHTLTGPEHEVSTDIPETVRGVPPTPPDTRPAILRRIDAVIAGKKDGLVDRIRRIKNDDAVRFSGMTRDEIRNRFTLVLTGNENSAQLRNIQSIAINRRMEAGALLRAAEQKRKSLDDAYSSARIHVEGEILAANMTAGRNEKVSDKAREVLSRQVYDIGDPEEMAFAVCEEIEWKGIVRDLDAFLKTSENNAMLLMSENKNTR